MRWAQIAPLWRAVFVVELLVAAVVVPLQFASLAVVTLPLTLPFILDLQAAGPAAVAEGGRRGGEAGAGEEEERCAEGAGRAWGREGDSLDCQGASPPPTSAPLPPLRPRQACAAWRL